jgi:hypothetical protein
MTMVVRRRSRVPVGIGPVLARQIGGDDRVGESAMGMTGLAMVMVRLRVNMDQRHGQHPRRQPREDHHACPQRIREPVWHEPVHLDLAGTVAHGTVAVKENGVPGFAGTGSPSAACLSPFLRHPFPLHDFTEEEW